MNLKLAKGVSVVTNPIAMLSLFVIATQFNELNQNLLKSMIMVLIAFSAAVALYVVTLDSYKSNWFKHIDLNQRERMYILFNASLGSMFCVGMFTINNQESLAGLFMVLTIYFGVAGIITMFITKVSMHTSALTLVAVGSASVSLIMSGALLFVLPALIWSRYTLHKHTPLQLIGGVIIGFTLGGFSLL